MTATVAIMESKKRINRLEELVERLMHIQNQQASRIAELESKIDTKEAKGESN